ncbi:LOW QUALITY PROTEIN: NXPE family member 3-like [Psammomys obesus]|uniref:LOW QUALITY PROTEIN: NXPE family member 3-like n=1 Tax=Psammomys obesus TaxID=48139 RepID=UPI0024533521|nr:LOW QUALITY PROTEIN: NXPE family member 3-like [Psammomys obesus]
MMSWPEPVTRWIPQPLPAAAYVSESVNWDSLPQEFTNLTSLLYWPPTGGHNSDFLASTSPKTSTYHLVGPAQATYILGSNLEAILVARDHWGRPKAHGGDLFRAQLLGPEVKAGVPGEVKDLENGTYLLSFPLLWAGRAQVQVRLIHSSEAVGVLQRVWRETRATVDFRGYFQGTNGIQEVVTCNVDPQSTGARGPTCQYKDVVSGEIWFCAQPPTLPCSALVGHSSGRYLKVTTPHDELLLAGLALEAAMPPWPPVSKTLWLLPPSRWHSTFCSSRSFPTADSILSCLAGRIVYMMGDSTLRQWWEYLRDTVPCERARGEHACSQGAEGRRNGAEAPA